ncbi:hypothetical protein [Leptospira mtsangambouensis]|uniref:hypothetical protein n=1 Tax=Leptospira mtsangambouensis TaxID=2484912 RepID=UPI001EEC2F62|nr:hypothetical protein [Leptospira mtsangambouensis]
MSPLFFNQNSLSPFFSLGKLTHKQKVKNSPFETKTSKEGSVPSQGMHSNSLGQTKKIATDQRTLLANGLEREVQTNFWKVENRLRWTQWMAIQSDSKSMEVSDLKPIWNYLLGETGFSDLLSYIDPDAKESLQMVVEPKNKGLVLYVFWESETTGAMGIQFHYDPEKEKPILVQITREKPFQNQNLSQSLANLVRDFPQIRSVQVETWKEETFNGDYR